MRKFIVSALLALGALAISIGPVLADSVGPTP